MLSQLGLGEKEIRRCPHGFSFHRVPQNAVQRAFYSTVVLNAAYNAVVSILYGGGVVLVGNELTNGIVAEVKYLVVVNNVAHCFVVAVNDAPVLRIRFELAKEIVALVEDRAILDSTDKVVVTVLEAWGYFLRVR